LVSEFASRHCMLTTVIGTDAFNSFADLDGDIVKTTVNLPFENLLKARKELMRITKHLRTGAHGNVEA
jgi:hypothetical protein